MRKALATALVAFAAGTAGDVPAAAAPLPADLAQLPRPQLIFTGAVQNEELGIAPNSWESRPIAESCDLDGDGVDDLALGAWGYDEQTGRVFVSRGGPGLAGGVVTGLAQTVTIHGFEDSKGFGVGTECAGDFDGDGFDDLLVSSANRGSAKDVPTVYVVLGGAGFFAQSSLDVSAAGARAVPIQGPAGQMLDDGRAVPLGDLDGDGKADLAFALPMGGKLFLVHGRDASALSGPIRPTDPTEARELLSSARSYPVAFTPVGDLDGDGHDELVLARSAAEDQGGLVEVISGAFIADDSQPSFDPTKEAAGERLLFRAHGEAKSGAGFAVAGVPDLNGDGRDELAIGSRWKYGDPDHDPDRPRAAGQVHVVFGTVAHDPIDLANLGSGGYAITGPGRTPPSSYATTYFGASIAVSPDLNGDGLAELLVGAPSAQNPAMSIETTSGRGYVIYGQSGTAPIDTAELGAEQGAVLYGTHHKNNLGLSAASLGDVDGNGLPDLAFGGWTKNFTGKGEVRVLSLGELPLPPDPGPGPGPGPVPGPAPRPGPSPAPAPPAAVTEKPSVKRLGKQVKPNGKGLAGVARVSCPGGGGACAVKAPKRVRVKIGGQKFWAQVKAPKRLGAGKSAVVRVKLNAAALALLAGRKLAVTVPVSLVQLP